MQIDAVWLAQAGSHIGTLLPQKMLATLPTKPHHGAWISIAGSQPHNIVVGGKERC